MRVPLANAPQLCFGYPFQSAHAPQSGEGIRETFTKSRGHPCVEARETERLESSSLPEVLDETTKAQPVRSDLTDNANDLLVHRLGFSFGSGGPTTCLTSLSPLQYWSSTSRISHRCSPLSALCPYRCASLLQEIASLHLSRFKRRGRHATNCWRVCGGVHIFEEGKCARFVPVIRAKVTQLTSLRTQTL